MKRWHVIVSYIPQHMEDHVSDIEELEELQAIIEHGPDWNLIDAIQVTLNVRRRASV